VDQLTVVRRRQILITGAAAEHLDRRRLRLTPLRSLLQLMLLLLTLGLDVHHLVQCPHR